MKTYTKTEFDQILDLHEKWLRGESEGVKADLTNANLTNANLTGANLTNANLTGADLTNANLTHADLFRANLTHADLSGANLTHADLSKADLSDANLANADLSNAVIDEANKNNIIENRSIVPQDGSFVGYKKVKSLNSDHVILKLEICEDAKRVGGLTSRKCRASKVKVLAAFKYGQPYDGVCMPYHNYRDENFTYEVGKVIEVDDFNDDPCKVCAPGIHFFINRSEAENYYG